MARRWLCLLLALTLLGGALPAARAEQAKWTVLVYLCGSDLESRSGEASEDIREILASGTGASGAVNVLAATGGASRWQRYGISSNQVQYYNLQGDAPLLIANAGRASMGSADTLAAFLRYGLANAPAEHCMLILWDHGGGPVYGVCDDENFRGDALTLSELRDALARGLNGARLDLLAFDACLMNSVDSCALAADYADYTVASQEMVTGRGFDYDAWLKPLAAQPDMDALTLAGLVASTYISESGSGRGAETATMSVVRSAGMAEVVRAANAFGAALTPLLDSRLSSVTRLRDRLTSFGEFIDEDASDLLDIQTLCEAFSALLPNESAALKSAAASAVVCNETTSDIRGKANGLSLFMPYSTAGYNYADIMSQYGGQGGAYAAMVTAMARDLAQGDYTMTATHENADTFYCYDGQSEPSGALCSIWDGLYGDTVTAVGVAQNGGGSIWSGLSQTSSGIWSGLNAATPTAAPGGGIWSGLPTAAPTSAPDTIWTGQPTAAPEAQAQTAALSSIWAGLINTGDDYYQPDAPNANVEPGISEAVSPGAVIAAAQDYFSSSTLTTQSVYTMQLTRQDLDHLTAANGVLFQRDGAELVRLGNMGQTTIDWSTGLIFSMFDGAWPALDGEPVCAERLYTQEDGSVRFAIPARINGLKMYLLAARDADGSARVLGATQGYDENGMAIRGSIPLEPGMTVVPLYTALNGDDTRREWEGRAITVPEGGLVLAWQTLPEGDYEYCFGLTDLSGGVQYTQRMEVA